MNVGVLNGGLPISCAKFIVTVDQRHVLQNMCAQLKFARVNYFSRARIDLTRVTDIEIKSVQSIRQPFAQAAQ
jgi:hypothetical protein